MKGGWTYTELVLTAIWLMLLAIFLLELKREI
jgi:hypothetical protein